MKEKYPMIPFIFRMKSLKRVTSDQDSPVELPKERAKIQVIIDCDETKMTRDEIERLGTIKYCLPMIHSYVLEVFEDEVSTLSGISGVVKVEQDAHLTAQMDIAKESVNATWHLEQSKKGEGVTVAVLDTGVFPHKDLTAKGNRIIVFKDFVNQKEMPYDDNGHGTHVAGIIGGDGYESKGKYAGVAPLCKIAGVKVLGKDGSGNISDVLAGIQWVLDNREKYNIQIMNLSVGMEDIEGETAALVKGVDAAWDQGLVVICAAGNNGPDKSSITTPGISRKVITVGSSDDVETVSIQGDVIDNYSGRGPTKSCVKKPDIVAPGSKIYSLNANPNYPEHNKVYPVAETGYIEKSGTSMATPILSGIIARLLSDIPDLANKDIKFALKYSTNNLGYTQDHQGWGLVDYKKLYNYFAT